MYTPDERALLAGVIEDAIKKTAPGLVVITDEIYEKITFGASPLSLGSLPASPTRRTINGMSKAYAMTGRRIGYMAGSGGWPETRQGRRHPAGQMSTNITSFTYPRSAPRSATATTS